MMHAYHYIGGHEQYLCREPGQPWKATCTCPDYNNQRRAKAKFCVHLAQARKQQLKDDTAAYQARIKGSPAPKKRKLADLKEFTFDPKK